jgi:hypothetical protein
LQPLAQAQQHQQLSIILLSLVAVVAAVHQLRLLVVVLVGFAPQQVLHLARLLP